MKIDSNVEENATGETQQFTRQQLFSRDKMEPIGTVCVSLHMHTRTQELVCNAITENLP